MSLLCPPRALESVGHLRPGLTRGVSSRDCQRRPPGFFPMRQQHQERYGFRSGPEPGDQRLDPVETGLGRLLHAAEALPAGAVSLLVADELVAHDPAGLAEMDALASMRLRQSLVARWEYGWQPADLVHVVRRSRSRLVPLLATAILIQVRAAVTAVPPPPSWQDQLRAVADE